MVAKGKGQSPGGGLGGLGGYLKILYIYINYFTKKIITK
jgi:hypothetical protein